VDVDLGLDDGDQPRVEDLVPDLELLCDDGLDPAGLASSMTERIFVPNIPCRTAFTSTCSRSGIGA
jgi:hypothetical protein